MYFNSIVFLRAVAALAVCFFHFTCGNSAYLVDTNWIKIAGKFGSYGVDVFFVVSGFVIPYSLAQKNYTLSRFFAFMRSRFWRIEIPYLASLLLAVCMAFLVASYKKTAFHFDWTQLLAHVLYLNSFIGIDWLVPVYWTLAIEFQYYVWIGLLFPYLLPKKNIFIRYISWGIWIALSFLIPKDVFLFQYVGLFGMGIHLCQFHLKQLSKTECCISMAVCIGLVIGHIGLFSALIGGIASLFILYEIAQQKTIKIPYIWAFLGKTSYSLYLTHVLVAGKVIGFTEQKTTDSFLRIAMIPVAMLIAVIIAYVFYQVVEKNIIFKNFVFFLSKHNTRKT